MRTSFENEEPRAYRKPVRRFHKTEALQILDGTDLLPGNSVERAYPEVKVMAIGVESGEIRCDLTVREMGLRS